jgi:hypothetical protein
MRTWLAILMDPLTLCWVDIPIWLITRQLGRFVTGILAHYALLWKTRIMRASCLPVDLHGLHDAAALGVVDVGVRHAQALQPAVGRLQVTPKQTGPAYGPATQDGKSQKTAAGAKGFKGVWGAAYESVPKLAIGRCLATRTA